MRKDNKFFVNTENHFSLPFGAGNWKSDSLLLSRFHSMLGEERHKSSDLTSYVEMMTGAVFKTLILPVLQSSRIPVDPQVENSILLRLRKRQQALFAGVIEKLNPLDLTKLLNQQSADLWSISKLFIAHFPLAAELSYSIILSTLKDLQAIIGHISQEQESLARFLGSSVDHIDNIELGLGDPHRAGSVSRVHFRGGHSVFHRGENGSYHFLLKDVWDLHNSLCHGSSYKLRSPSFLSFSDHTWVEAITYSESKDLVTFYKNLGCILFYCYALQIKDIHMENIICDGVRPVLVDYEAILHPDILMDDLNKMPMIMRDWSRTLNRSVQSIGILPDLINYAGDGLVDLSGLSGKDAEGAELQNIPVSVSSAELHKIIVDHSAHILDGFCCAQRIVENHRQRFTSIVEKHSGIHSRVIVRPTQTYGKIINHIRHPRSLTHVGYLDAALNKLNYQISGINPTNLRSIERKSILSMCIPKFIVCHNSNEIIENFDVVSRLERSVIDLVKEIICSTDAGTAARQTMLIAASISILDESHKLYERNFEAEYNSEHQSISKSNLTTIERLVADSQRHKKYAGGIPYWPTYNPGEKGMKSLSINLYTGLAGALLGLKDSGSILLAEEKSLLYRELIACANYQACRTGDDGAYLSLMEGFAGLFHLGKFHQKDKVLLVEFYERYTDRFISALRNSTNLTLSNGIAGAVIAFQEFDDLHALATARLESVLTALAPARPNALSDLGFGYLHGLSGLCLAASCTPNLTERADYPELMTTLMQDEVDQLLAANMSQSLLTVNNGIPGMVVARCRILRHTHHRQLRASLTEQIHVLTDRLKECLALYSYTNDSVGVGSAGFHAMMHEISLSGIRKPLEDLSELLSSPVAALQRPIRYRTPGRIYSPSLMEGASGMAAILHAISERTPTFLSFEEEQ